MRILAYSLLLAMLNLMACAGIEHRSDKPLKTQMPEPVQAFSLQPLWKNTALKRLQNNSRLMPCVDNHHVYLADSQGGVLALQAKTGLPIWQQSLSQNLNAGPSKSQHQLYLATSQGTVVALDAAKGTRLWQASLSNEVLSAPVADPERLYVLSFDGSLTALSQKDGTQLWRYSISQPSLLLRRSAQPVIYEGTVISGFSNGKLVALARADGSLVWEQELASPKGHSDLQRMVDISADPVIFGDHVYAVSYQGRLASLDAKSGQLNWERDLSSFSGLTVDKQTVMISDTEGVIWALSRSTGDVVWKNVALKGRRLTKPTIFAGQLYVADETGYLFELSLADGRVLSHFKVDSQGIEAAPVAKENHLYVLGQGGVLMVLQKIS